MTDKRIKKTLITIALIILTALLIWFYYYHIFIRPFERPFSHHIKVKIAGLDHNIKAYKEEKKHYPHDAKEIIFKLGGEYINWNSSDRSEGEFSIFDLPEPPENNDEYFKTNINILGKLVYSGYYLSNSKFLKTYIELKPQKLEPFEWGNYKVLKTYLELKPMYLGYYVNKDLTSYAIYGVDKENKIYRDKRYKNTIYFHSNN